MDKIFAGERGFVHTLIDAFGTTAILHRGKGTEGDGGTASESVKEEARFVCTTKSGREGAARVTVGQVSTREPTALRRREERVAGILSAVGLSAAPRAAIDRLLVAGREYRLETVEAIEVCGRVAAYRLEGARS